MTKKFYSFDHWMIVAVVRAMIMTVIHALIHAMIHTMIMAVVVLVIMLVWLFGSCALFTIGHWRVFNLSKGNLIRSRFNGSGAGSRKSFKFKSNWSINYLYYSFQCLKLRFPRNP